MFSFVYVFFILRANNQPSKVLRVFPLIKYFWPIYLSLCDKYSFTFRTVFSAKETLKDQNSISLQKEEAATIFYLIDISTLLDK